MRRTDVSVLTWSAYLEFESLAGDIEVIYLLLPVSTATHTIYLQLFKRRRRKRSQEATAKKAVVARPKKNTTYVQIYVYIKTGKANQGWQRAW